MPETLKAGNTDRRALLAKIHIAKKDLALDEESCRALLKRRFGRSSAKYLSDDKLKALIKHFESLGFRPKPAVPKSAGRRCLAGDETHRKIRALWLSLYHLGLVADPSEIALAAFVKRQTGVDALRFLRPSPSYKVIEALKAWAARDAGVCWEPCSSATGPVDNPRARVMEAQWRLLHKTGAVRISSLFALDNWIDTFFAGVRENGIHHGSYSRLSPGDADRVIVALGDKIRKRKGQCRNRL